MNSENFTDIFREAWNDEDYNQLFFERSKEKTEGNFCFGNKNEPENYTECKLETNSR